VKEFIPLKRAAIFVLTLVCSLTASADSIKGVVRNDTTGKPSVGDKVSLKSPASGSMDDVATTKTNSKGEFSFEAKPSRMPYIVWVQHENVTYPRMAMPGPSPVAIRVYEAAPKLDVDIQEHLIVLHTEPSAPGTLKVDELYTLNNASTPPRTLVAPHTLELYLPENAKIEETTVQVPGNQPLKVALVPSTEKDKFAFGFPIRPGQSQFRVGYSLPYTGKLKVNTRLAAPVQNMLVVLPPSITFAPNDAALYQATSDPQLKGLSLYVAKNTTPQQQIGFEVSGTGEMPRAQDSAPAQAGAGNGQGRPDNAPGGGIGLPNEKPDPLQSGQWAFLGVMILFLTAGAVFIYTTTRHTVVEKPNLPQDRSGMLLEVMKDEVFQLESDRLQGKISTEEYQTAKSALDKTLQRAVQRQTVPAAN